jgi:hypothetical protein
MKADEAEHIFADGIFMVTYGLHVLKVLCLLACLSLATIQSNTRVDASAASIVNC